MKKAIGVAIGVIILAALVLAMIPTIQDEIHWQWASHKDEVASYESYIETWPAGRYASEAQTRYDERAWADALAANKIEEFKRYTELHPEGKYVAKARDRIEDLHWEAVTGDTTLQGLEKYLQLHPDGSHADEARESIEDLHWKKATTSNTIRSYQDYIVAYPQGQYLQEAEEKVAALSTDNTPFEEAISIGTENSIKQFLEDFPGHQREPCAQQAIKDITEGRNIVDLLSEKKIEIETQGSGIQNVQVRMRSLVPYPITVRIPVGSYFVSSRQSSQNMITTAESRVRLTGDGWRSVSVSAACANMPRDIPGSEDTFTIQRSPHQEELARLIPVLDKAGVNFATRQAAVWIVTDNASYSDLGNLVSRPAHSPFGGTRMIREADVTRAMKLCTEAGIDIKSKAIWRDRQRILNGLEDEELKTWLEQN